MSQATTLQRPPVQTLSPHAMVFLLSLGIGLAVVFVQFMDVGQHLADQIFQHTGLGRARGLDRESWLGLLLACANDAVCAPWLGPQLQAGLAGFWLAPLLPLVTMPVAYKVIPAQKRAVRKDPGLATWETKDRLGGYLRGNERPEDPFLGTIGYLKSGKSSGDFDARELPQLFVPLEEWCQNTLVWGGIRAGKTTAFFQPNIFLAAHLPMTCVVFDVKWPQKNSGFYETLGYWTANGRPAVLLAPFERTGASVNVLAGADTFSDCLEIADSVFPPPEFMDERGKHYNDKKRFLIAALVFAHRKKYGDQADLGGVLRAAMSEDAQILSMISDIQNDDVANVIKNFKAAGDNSMAETKNGIVSALKVFFDEDVVLATSAKGGHVIDPTDCLRTPTLVLIGINQKNQLDGSAEVLFRLYKRIFDRAAMQVAEAQGGRLTLHLAYWMDELPAIGKVNYLMRSLGTLRSYNVSHHLGIQNMAQGELVYGESYWKAMTTNVIARLVMFPRGINGDDAARVSEAIGKTTALDVTVTGSRNLNPLEPDASQGSTGRLTEVHLLAYEEFPTFGLGEAVVRVNGHQPIRTQLIPMNMPFVSGPGIRPRSRRNDLYPLYQATLDRCGGDLVAYTQRLIREGQCRGAKLGDVAAPQPTQAPSRSQPDAPDAPGRPATFNEEYQKPPQEAITWIETCLQALIPVEMNQDKNCIQVRRSSLPEAVNGERHYEYLLKSKLVRISSTGEFVTVEPVVMEQVPDSMVTYVQAYARGFGPHAWLRANAKRVTGHPERETYLTACQASSATPDIEVVDALWEETQNLLVCSSTVLREMQLPAGDYAFPKRVVRGRQWNEIPMQDLMATAQAVAQASQAESLRKPEQSRRQKKRVSPQELAAQVVQRGDDA